MRFQIQFKNTKIVAAEKFNSRLQNGTLLAVGGVMVATMISCLYDR